MILAFSASLTCCLRSRRAARSASLACRLPTISCFCRATFSGSEAASGPCLLTSWFWAFLVSFSSWA